jgi:predicted RNase H-like nuclease
VPTLTAQRLLAMGMDGARHGWVAAAAFERGTRTAFFADVAQMADWRAGQADGGDAPVAIDMPIGLPREVGLRACDREARALLGGRRSSVFPPPGRFLLEAVGAEPLFGRVQELVAARGGLGLSRQAAGLLPKIHDLDGFLRADLARAGWLFEVHPELSFREMNDGAPPRPKSSAAGALERLGLVRRPFPDATRRIERDDAAGQAGLGDVLDAYAALWTALRRREGRARALGDGDDPATGLAMRIWI